MTPSEPAGPDRADGPWNPGIGSHLTRELLALSTLFRPSNARNDLAQALELRDVTGLPIEDLAVFRPERLALHEVLVRVTADFEVPDPATATVPSLGVNSRQIVQALLARAVEPIQAELALAYDRLREEVGRIVADALSSLAIDPGVSSATEPSGPAPRARWGWFRKAGVGPSAPKNPPVRETEWERAERIVSALRAKAEAATAPVEAAALQGLLKAVCAVRLKQGRLSSQQTFLAPLATDLACNAYGGPMIGRLIEPHIRRVAESEGFRLLPAQERPVLMVIKGASASGKSTMRPLQRALAARMGLSWGEFALISPDIWRRALLDYEALGDLYKYAGMLSGQELAIIDQKLDSYLVHKGEKGLLPHLLIDRFRFDSFALDSEENRTLVSRFGRLLCYVFMITPPHETVERAWRRGLEVGRYKAVDDLLAHNVEAFTGMQQILFGRALSPNDSLHYEFLDNDVPRGAVPLTVAFGWGGQMTVFDIRRLLDISRYCRIDVDAKEPAEVYPDDQGPARNADFLANCLRRFPRLNLAERASGRIYAQFAGGSLVWSDPDAFERTVTDEDARAALRVAAPDLFGPARGRPRGEPERIARERFPTLGRWGPDA